jgi:hypothetical protein
MRRDVGLLLVSVALIIVASLSYLYEQRYIGLVPEGYTSLFIDLIVIVHPFREYALPLSTLGALALVSALYLRLQGTSGTAPSQPFSPAALNLAFFVAVGLIMKVAAEVMHEVGGHGFYVLLFGGRILGVYISLLWPLESSYVWWSLPDLGSSERALVMGGGILNCVIVSFILQLFLFLRPRPWRLAVSLLWFSFWNYISSAGYLLSGGFGAFGDVAELIEMGFLTGVSSLLLGLAVFIVGYILLSIVLRRLLRSLVSAKKFGYTVAGFWLTTALIVTLTVFNPQVKASPALIPVGFIPALLWLVLERLWRRKDGGKTPPESQKPN